MDASTTQDELTGIDRDDEGFLLDPDDWTPALARVLAAEAGQALGDEHWRVIDFIRDSFDAAQTVPEARKLLKFMQSEFGPERGTRRYLYRLFPTGYAQTACKIAGMRKPLKLMLDI